MRQALHRCRTVCVLFARVCGLVFAVVGVGVGLFALASQPGELVEGTRFFVASKIVFFYVLFPAYVYGFATKGNWLTLGVCVAIVVLLCLDVLFSASVNATTSPVRALAISSAALTAYGLLVAPLSEYGWPARQTTRKL